MYVQKYLYKLKNVIHPRFKRKFFRKKKNTKNNFFNTSFYIVLALEKLFILR